MSTFDELFGTESVMLILRNLSATDTVATAEAAWELGVVLVEIPIGQTDQIPALRATVSAAQARGLTVGAGTVTTPAHVSAAVEAGAAYAVSPGLSEEVASECRRVGIPYLPGVATPTEVQRALDLGLEWVKVFPASTLGPRWFKAVRGPFPDVKMVATGGIAPAVADDYLDAGARIVGMGSALNEPEQLRPLLRR
ncbi:bifunctional 4-hydroxy-2-oxoglutarate aldolase/2-dehydro-3-deoxy-phosphogluconate aldolase [Haloglycomyces albus]|uniref:bifunctional 4-hydroxy-2-oxoglutarate aldolase/2-dehydro-3-deoxy-phosphogluconate aldolase n=1 Tax=Haloglycomyces albus TaxID=526067 RepID=UPI00046CA5CA|nr:bifunctional 4-hydroxy-2-oxoglutarate aldolase/2-dehydro-3-deoxy-phosphogluconate aldolase [Haloglycomyces albus]